MVTRSPATLGGLFLGLILIAIGVVGGLAYAKFGPLTALERRSSELETRLSRAQATIKEKDSRITTLEVDLHLERSGHGATRGRLERQVRQAQGTIGQQSAAILSQQRDIYILRTCLKGIVEALNHADNNNEAAAVQSIESVERECRAAAQLLYR